MNDPRLDRVYVPLKLTFGLVPVVAGLDKYFNILTDWSGYLSPWMAELLPVGPGTFMALVGAIEIVVGLAILTRFTRLGAYVAAAWLALIAFNLILAGALDVAVRDLVMAVAAYSLGTLATLKGLAWIPGAAPEARRLASDVASR